jgi:GTPase SAR1 family protein
VYAECAEHGTCDAVTGVCVCQRGYNGPACDDTSDHEDRHVFDHDGPFFSGSLMKVNAKRFSAPEFNLFQAVVNGENLTTIGAAFMAKTIVVEGCTVNYQVWDTAGQERYHSIAR